MGRLSEFFNQHRDNVEDAVERALDKADSTIDSLSRRVEELEQKLRDVAGEKPVNKDEAAHQENVVTSEKTSNTTASRVKPKNK